MSKHEKNKSSGSGLLEGWFGRPKSTKGTPYSTGTLPGGRPTSTDADVFDVQELESKIESLTDSAVEIKFVEILEDMNIPKDKRTPLLKKTSKEKRKMIFMHLKGKRIAVDSAMKY